MPTQLVDGPRLERTAPVVEADAPKAEVGPVQAEAPAPTTSRPSRPAPPAPPAVPLSGLGPAGRRALGLGIPLVVTLLTASLLGAWAPLVPPTSSADQLLVDLLCVAWAVGIVGGAYLLRAWWALAAVPVAAVAGTYLGIALANVTVTAARLGLSAGFDPGSWPRGDLDGWFIVLLVVVPASLLFAALGAVMGLVRAQQRQRGAW